MLTFIFFLPNKIKHFSIGANLSSSAVSTGQTLKSMRNIKIQTLHMRLTAKTNSNSLLCKCDRYLFRESLFRESTDPLVICSRISLTQSSPTWTVCWTSFVYLTSPKQCTYMPVFIWNLLLARLLYCDFAWCK